MIIDSMTLTIASGAVVTIAGVSFVLNNVLRRTDPVGRTWSVAFVAGILVSFAYAIYEFAPSAWGANALGNGALALSLGALWAGSRQFNGRPSLLWVALAGSLLAGLATAVQGEDGGSWAGAAETFIVIAVFAALAAIETTQGMLRRSMNARVLTVVFAAVALYYGGRAVVFIAEGEDGVLFNTVFSTVTTTFVTIVLVILAALSMSLLAATRTLVGAEETAQGTPTIPGVVERPVFEQHAQDWLARAQRDRDSLVLMVLDIDNLAHMNTAFGREYGDQAIYAVGRIACVNSPSSALVGHLGGPRFAILTTVPAVGDAVVVAEQLQTALVETPIDPIEGIRAIATCGLSTTETVGYSFTALQKAAVSALDRAGTAGPGSIVTGVAAL